MQTMETRAATTKRQRLQGQIPARQPLQLDLEMHSLLDSQPGCTARLRIGTVRDLRQFSVDFPNAIVLLPPSPDRTIRSLAPRRKTPTSLARRPVLRCTERLSPSLRILPLFSSLPPTILPSLLDLPDHPRLNLSLSCAFSHELLPSLPPLSLTSNRTIPSCLRQQSQHRLLRPSTLSFPTMQTSECSSCLVLPLTDLLLRRSKQREGTVREILRTSSLLPHLRQ